MKADSPLKDFDLTGLDEAFIQSLLLGEVVSRILKKRAQFKLTSKPRIEKRLVAEFRKRMRISSIEKFECTTYIASINFYLDEKAMEKHDCVAVLVIYIGEDYIYSLLKKLGYPMTNDSEEEDFSNACGTLCNLIAGKFKEGMVQLGYQELIMSHFSTYTNQAPMGVEYPHKVEEKFDVSFEISGEIQLVAELVIGHVPLE